MGRLSMILPFFFFFCPFWAFGPPGGGFHFFLSRGWNPVSTVAEFHCGDHFHDTQNRLMPWPGGTLGFFPRRVGGGWTRATERSLNESRNYVNPSTREIGSLD